MYVGTQCGYMQGVCGGFFVLYWRAREKSGALQTYISWLYVDVSRSFSARDVWNMAVLRF